MTVAAASRIPALRMVPAREDRTTPVTVVRVRWLAVADWVPVPVSHLTAHAPLGGRGFSIYSAAMDADGFWEIIDRAGSPEGLQRELGTLAESELADFEVEHAKAYAAAYDWGLWGAAYVIAGGCSDDSFDYFRGYLIGLGRRVYEAALANPDSLADVEVDDGEEWEDWMSPTMVVVEARTGKYDFVAPERHPSQPGEPTGEDWDEESEELAARFPRLWAKYGDDG